MGASTGNHARALHAHVRRLKHDLGKYIQLFGRNLPPEPPLEMLRKAVRADVERTRRGPRGVEDAWAVWARYRGVLVGEEELEGARFGGDPRVCAIERDLEHLARLQPFESAARADLERARALCARISGQIDALERDLRVVHDDEGA